MNKTVGAKVGRKPKARRNEMLQIRHKSDCALHNAPAYEPKPCDCGVERELLSILEMIIKRGRNLLKATEDITGLAVVSVDFKVWLDLLTEKVAEE